MSSYSGSYRERTDLYTSGPKVDPRTGLVRLRNRGVARAMRALRREEAESRNAKTPHDRRKAHRLNRCDCPGVAATMNTPTVKRRRQRARR